MSDTLITVVAILLAAVLMFIFPLLSISERGDDISQLSVLTATTEFVDDSYVLTNPISPENIRGMRENMNDTDVVAFDQFLERNWGIKPPKLPKYDENGNEIMESSPKAQHVQEQERVAKKTIDPEMAKRQAMQRAIMQQKMQERQKDVDKRPEQKEE